MTPVIDAEGVKSSRVRILGVNFHTSDLGSAIKLILDGGLLVAPSGPGMAVDLVQSGAYRRALTSADVAITDSGWMVLLWLAGTGQYVPRHSGLKMIRALLQREDLKKAGAIFWVMPNAEEDERNRVWLNSVGVKTPKSCTYVAPRYGAGEVEDAVLVDAIEAQKPKLVMLCVGGGVQERLGLALRESLSYRPGIACLGAAIAFLSGGQAQIPTWADKLLLGWAFRIAQDPRRFWRRYWSAFKLAPLMMRYRDRLPDPPSGAVALTTASPRRVPLESPSNARPIPPIRPLSPVRGGASKRAQARKLRILIVVEPGLDGVFRHVEGLVAYLQTQDISLHLAYSSRRCGAAMLRLVERVRAAGGETVDLRVTNYPELRDVPALMRLVALMRRVRPHIVHTHSSKAGVLGRFASVLLRHRHCFYSPQAYYGMAKPPVLKVRFYNWVERSLGSFGTTIAISEDEAAFARTTLRVPASRIRIIHNPVNSTYFVPAEPEQRLAARKALGIPQNAVVMGFIGRMCWQKDPETAYAGMAPVCSQNPNLMLFHLGWGKWKEYLLNVAGRLGMEKQMRIIEYSDDPRSFYHAIDALLVSSRYEAGWPLVFLEAMSCNLPVVAATGIGMSDVGKAGLSHVWTFPPEHVADCTAAVTKWLECQRQGINDCNHRAFAIARLSPERCFGAVYDLYRNMHGLGSVSPF